jgi:hypothetical protein
MVRTLCIAAFMAATLGGTASARPWHYWHHWHHWHHCNWHHHHRACW